MKNYTNQILLIIIGILLLISNCKTTIKKIESKDKFINKEDSSLISKKALATFVIKKDKDKTIAVLTSPFIFWSKVIGSLEQDQNNNYNFYIEKIEYITNWPNGWTEGTNEASGKIILQKQNDIWRAKVEEPFRMQDVIKGEIRYFDDFYIETKGLEKVKNRMDRIKEINLFLKQNNLPEFFGNVWFKTSYGEPFKKVIKKILFDKKTVYPENLMKLKESGTIKRDVEEATGLFFMDYNIDYFFNKILNDSIFIEKK